MHIGVGSGNPVKRRAVEAVLAQDLAGATVDAPADMADAKVVSVPVDSGVSEQPTGQAETIEGAETRARNVLAVDEYDLGVGLEGGVSEFREEDDLYLIMWAAVTDGERVGRGAGPSFALPESIASRVREGEELGPVMDDVLGENEVARKQGAAGAFSGGRVDREAALAAGVAAALGPFVTDRYR